MARKSNKTAHVLNLIAGHEASKDNTENTEETTSEESTDKAGAAPARAEASAPAPVSSSPQNISVIDTTEEDPISDLIQQKLSRELEEHLPAEPDPGPVIMIDPDLPPTIEEPEPEPEPVSQAEPVLDAASSSDGPAAPETEAPAESQAEPARTPEATLSSQTAATEPEPEFVRWNVMERIVEDKIIYFMRQFDVCTCDRCVNDTIALTLNGLLPKYLVTTPAAVDPLLSYYTNRLISDVTVEATKACMIVKENPRH
ncbi:MAG: late competence development ComFB family protein [Lachnospiraceae bacterium]